MDSEPKEIWQIAAGETDRSYANVFLQYQVALLGPGDVGPVPSDEEGFERWISEATGPWDDPRTLRSVFRSFRHEVSIGDAMALRVGQGVRAIGIVAGHYEYFEQFDDVNGWDLRHGRRVRWFEFPKEQKLSLGRVRFSRIQREDHREFVLQTLRSPPQNWQTSPLPKLPPVEPPLENVPDELGPVVAEARDLSPLYWGVERARDLPSEDETIVHLVVPLLKALGWRSEQIAVEWKDIDIALFSRLPRIPENCRFVFEAKRCGEALEAALDQAKGYVEKLHGNAEFVRTGPGSNQIKIVPKGQNPLPDIVLTDGFRYRLHSAKDGYRPVAYANLKNLKRPAGEFFSRLRRAEGGGK